MTDGMQSYEIADKSGRRGVNHFHSHEIARAVVAARKHTGFVLLVASYPLIGAPFRHTLDQHGEFLAYVAAIGFGRQSVLQGYHPV